MSVGFRYHVLPCCLEIQSVLSLYNQTSLFLSIYLHYFSVEAEFATTEKEMTERHAAEIAALESGGGDEAEAAPAEASADDAKDEQAPAQTPAPAPAAETEEERRLKKQEKARKKKLEKKQRQLDAEKRREEEIEAERLAAGPAAKELEIKRMEELYLKPAGLRIRDVAADGNCLYRAVAEQCANAKDFMAVRTICADALLENEEEYAPFAESHDHGSYDNYVERVRSSADWGGHLELRALATALKRPVVVYSADAAPLRMGEEEDGEDILLSYHRHYYALGEHYNSVTTA